MEVPGDPAGSQAVDDGRNRRRVVADHHHHRLHTVGEQRLHGPLDQAQAAQPQQRLRSTSGDRSDPLGPARGQHHTHPRQHYHPGRQLRSLSHPPSPLRVSVPSASPSPSVSFSQVAPLAAGHGPSEGLPVDRVQAGGTHRDPNPALAGARIRIITPLQDLRTPAGPELHHSHQHSSPGLTAAAKCPTAPAVPGDAA